MLTRQLAVDYSQGGVRVNAICPGFIDTPQLQYYVAEQDDPDAALAEVASLHPIGRVGQPDEVAAPPHPWRRVYSISARHAYYYNLFTGESQWTRPESFPLSPGPFGRGGAEFVSSINERGQECRIR